MTSVEHVEATPVRVPLHAGSERRLQVSVPAATMWTGEQAPRPCDEAALADLPDPAAWAAALSDAEREDLHGRTLTQLLLGEQVWLVQEDGEWAQVRALLQGPVQGTSGYPGWVRRTHLAARVDRPDPDGPPASVVVTAPWARCVADDGSAFDVSYGTALWTDRTTLDEGDVPVLLPGGRRARLPEASVRHVDWSQPQPSYDADAVLADGRQFLDGLYLWGGTTGWGFDCSGLVHLVLRANRVNLPRDARDQITARNLEAVHVDDVRPGDLYLFARPGQPAHHVGFASRAVGEDGTRWMLHAPEGGGIEDAPMSPDRLATLVAAARPIRR
ncbi:MAG: NlpC/P60 family protein [Nocardioidaceae bacterium]